MKKLFIDIGGTHLRSEVCSDNEIIKESVSSNDTGLLFYIDQQMKLHPSIDFIGISYAGQVDKGVIISAPNINIDKYEITSEVKQRYGIALEIDNDLNCALRAEAAYWKSSNIAALYIGTGIGAAVIDQGILIKGNANMAFEIGHIPYRETPLVCGCGRNNCVELYASGSGMAKWLRHYGSRLEPVLSQLKIGSDRNERLIVSEFEEALLHAAGVLVTLANPEILVLGGGVIEQNPYLATLLREKLRHYALSPALQGLRIEISVLENAPLMGAKLLERHHG
ncbi:ROK family protein [Sulfuricurvum sp.]|uniref:ROK family protein n=1 Tax=Sulfuricurvum sp. TaxID=2025608 RepID=UPI00286E2394|nr:ROK family protein [Sulfuricurvum sp.]